MAEAQCQLPEQRHGDWPAAATELIEMLYDPACDWMTGLLCVYVNAGELAES